MEQYLQAAYGLIGKPAFDFIVAKEDSDENYYRAHYRHFEWPEGASGPTVGIGYDCGYCTKEEIARDWSGIIPDDQVAILQSAAGLKGSAAANFVQLRGRFVTIEWGPAIAEFARREIPKWYSRVVKVLTNLEKLPPTCRGVLLSVAYNRGSEGYHVKDARHAEMYAIGQHMQKEEFDKIPAELRSMKRLWPNVKGLLKRREDEAILFEQGLKGVR